MAKLNVTSIEYLKDTFKIGYEAYEHSREEAKVCWDLFHNRQYTSDQEAILENRGQPKETFNVIKLFARMLIGYYSTVINNVQAFPKGIEDVAQVTVLNDAINHVLRDNNFIGEGEKVKLDGIISGLMVSYVDVESTGETDEFGRPHNRISLEHIPSEEVILDPMSRRDDYSDARYIHRFKWVTEEQIESLFGSAKAKKLEEYYNFTSQTDVEYDKGSRNREVGQFRQHNNYLIVHSIVTDPKGKVWSIFWHNDVQLAKKELTHKEVKFPYRVVKVHSSNEPEYYGLFREVIESQKAINQALIKLQLMVNTQKAFVQDGAVRNLAEFTNAFNRVNAVIPVQDLNGIRIENMSQEVLDQYTVIDKAFDRIQRILGINDSFLGMAFASDSGRKVKLQQNASIMSLRYLTGRIEAFYRFLGWDIANLIKQYYTSHMFLRVTDDFGGQRWVELNKPFEAWNGKLDPNTGMPQTEVEYEQVMDPASQEPMVDEDGNYVIAPIADVDTELSLTKFDIEIQSNAYNDEDEKSQLMLEQVMAGAVGQLLAQVNPAGFFKAAGLSMKTMKTKHSPEIASILDQTAMMLSQNQQAEQQAQGMAQGMPSQLAQQAGPQNGASSRTLNLPQNTNEQ